MTDRHGGMIDTIKLTEETKQRPVQFTEHGKELIREIVREELQRAGRPLWQEIWRALWIVLDAIAKRWAFRFESAFQKRTKE